MLLDDDMYDNEYPRSDPTWGDCVVCILVAAFIIWGVVDFIKNAMNGGCI